MKFTDGDRWWQYTNNGAGFALGTSLCYRVDWWKYHQFPDLMIGEDSGFTGAAAVQQQLAAQADLDLMYATIHPGNTSRRAYEQGWCWKLLPEFKWSDSQCPSA
jgi:hypothetical protein